MGTFKEFASSAIAGKTTIETLQETPEYFAWISLLESKGSGRPSFDYTYKHCDLLIQTGCATREELQSAFVLLFLK